MVWYFTGAHLNATSPLFLLCCYLSVLPAFTEERYTTEGEQHGPSAAARLHLDSSLSESQACSLHCPDSYLRN